MSSEADPADAIRSAEIAAGIDDWETAEDALLESLSRVRRRKQEIEK